MINDKRLLAVIPARGGSKRLPRKNILELAGKPLISWTIEETQKSTFIDRVVVSTEDHEIGEIAKQFGKEIPFYRPSSLAGDSVTTMEVLLQLIEELKKQDEFYDYIILLQPTSPLRRVIHIDEACRQLIDHKNAGAIVSVCPAEHHPLWSNTLPESRSMSSFLKKDMHNLRSQDLPDYYRLNGAIYICETDLLCSEKTFFPKDVCYAFIMSQEDSIDIDTKEDFDLAQLAMDSSILEKSAFFSQLYEEYKVKNSSILDYKQFTKYILNLINEQ